MRWLGIGLACLVLAGCGKAPDSGPGDGTTQAPDIAFAYRYDFRLPSNRIADAQEARARACEALGSVRCRITGMTYRLDAAGQVSASLDVRVATSIARAFGRGGIQAIEAAGGALTGAEITGTDAAPDIDAAATDRNHAKSDIAALDQRLAQSDPSPSVRSDLLSRRAALVEQLRQGEAMGARAQASIATTPVSFTYAAGTGVGLGARLSEAAQAGYASLTWTLATALTLLAYLGPPLLLLGLLAMLWHRVGRRLWTWLFPTTTT